MQTIAIYGGDCRTSVLDGAEGVNNNIKVAKADTLPRMLAALILMAA